MVIVVLLACVLCALGGLSAWLRYRVQAEKQVTHRLFHLWAVPSSALGQAEVTRIEGSRFLDALGCEEDDRECVSYAQGARTIISVPERYAATVPFAAAACGVVAQELEGVSPGDPQVSSVWIQGGEDSWQVLPVQSWILGLGTTGRRVGINHVPGLSVLLSGEEWQVEGALRELPWSEKLCRVLRRSDCLDLGQWREAWEESWDPYVVRILVDDVAETAATLTQAQLQTQTHGNSRVYAQAGSYAQAGLPITSHTNAHLQAQLATHTQAEMHRQTDALTGSETQALQQPDSQEETETLCVPELFLDLRAELASAPQYSRIIARDTELHFSSTVGVNTVNTVHTREG